MHDIPDIPPLGPGVRGRSLDVLLRSRQYADVLARLRPASGEGEFEIIEDVTDDHVLSAAGKPMGFRIIRFAWNRPSESPPEGLDPEAWKQMQQWEEKRLQADYGEYFREVMKPKASLVFDPDGKLIAIHAVDASSASMLPASLVGCQLLLGPARQ